MFSFKYVPEKVFLRAVFLHYLKWRKHQPKIIIFWWSLWWIGSSWAYRFARFKSVDFGLKDEERPRQPKKSLKMRKETWMCIFSTHERKLWILYQNVYICKWWFLLKFSLHLLSLIPWLINCINCFKHSVAFHGKFSQWGIISI